MKKIDVKSVILGIIVGTIGISTVYAAGGIKSAIFSQSKVYLNGQEVPLKNSLVSIVKDNESYAQMYMPMREFLEYMHIKVEWNPNDGSVNLITSDTIYHNHSNDSRDKNAATNIIINSKQNHVITIDIKELEAGEYVVLDLCEIQGSDTIIFDVTSNGKGTLFMGFMKDKDNFGTTYFGNGDFYGEKGIVKSSFEVNGFEGNYYFFVKNNGTETMGSIEGTVVIKK